MNEHNNEGTAGIGPAAGSDWDKAADGLLEAYLSGNAGTAWEAAAGLGEDVPGVVLHLLARLAMAGALLAESPALEVVLGPAARHVVGIDAPAPAPVAAPVAEVAAGEVPDHLGLLGDVLGFVDAQLTGDGERAALMVSTFTAAEVPFVAGSLAGLVGIALRADPGMPPAAFVPTARQVILDRTRAAGHDGGDE